MNSDAALALRTALVAAARDPTKRARAIAALRGAELWAATWPTDPSVVRTLTTSNGVTALPLFSDERELGDAAMRYAWLAPDGQTPRRQLPLWEALRLAKRQKVQLVVLDVASEHALELDEGDVELLSAAPSSKPPSNVKMPSSMKVRSTPPPPGDNVVRRASSRPEGDQEKGSGTYSPLRPRSVTPMPEAHGIAATFGATPTATMQALEAPPQEELLEALSDVLREFPEVEWACLVTSARADSKQAPSVAMRVDPQLRKNQHELTRRLREVSAALGTRHDVLMLDTHEQMKQARHLGTPFYPWRKK
ncbi:MAG TPA: SseB family protein [Polyangiales bacterium]